MACVDFFKALFGTKKSLVGTVSHDGKKKKMDVNVSVYGGEILCDHTMDVSVANITDTLQGDEYWVLEIPYKGRVWVVMPLATDNTFDYSFNYKEVVEQEPGIYALA